MKEYLLQLKEQTIGLWQKMTNVQRIIIGGSAALLLLVLILLARGAATPDYGALFTLADQQQAGQVVEKLKEKNIPYKVSDNGADGGVTIMVPSREITPTRLELAVENIPTGGVVGFESFDNTKFGETDTDRRARYLRALQGELTRTVEGMAEIDKARVHIVLPEPSLFLDEQKSATAAIMLKLKTNHKLEEGQVKGIVKLVSNSVEGLTAENVTIVDMAGNILSEDIGSEGNAGRLTVSQVEIQKQYQKDMQTSVQSMLEKILGLGKVVVRVQMELDFDKIQRKITDFGEKVVRSEQVSEETAQNTSTSSAGVPGTDSNIPGYETGEETGSSESSRTDKVRNYEIDTIEEIKEVAQGSVKRLSVAVVVDKEIDTKLQTEIENLVKSSVGFDGERGDQISLAGIPFNTEYQEEMTRQLAQAEKRQIYMYAGLAILAFVIIGVVIGVVVRRRRLETQIPLTGEIMARPFTVEDDEDIQIPEKEFTPEEKEQRKIKERVEKVAREQPDDVAQLIRSWLAQE